MNLHESYSNARGSILTQKDEPNLDTVKALLLKAQPNNFLPGQSADPIALALAARTFPTRDCDRYGGGPAQLSSYHRIWWSSELNFIEMYWGAAKFRYRTTPRTTNIDEMEGNVKKCLDEVPQLAISFDMQTEVHDLSQLMQLGCQAWTLGI